jgi:hypothetical protein
MRRLGTFSVGLTALAVALGSVGLLGGCDNDARQDGTMAPYDPEKQKIGQDKMMEYMQKKARGEVPGFGKSGAPTKK